MAAQSHGGGTMTARAAAGSPAIAAFRDYANLENFSLTAWVVASWLGKLDVGELDGTFTRAEVDHSARVLGRLLRILDAMEAEKPDDPDAVLHIRSTCPQDRRLAEYWSLMDTETAAPWGGPCFVTFRVETGYEGRHYVTTARRTRTDALGTLRDRDQLLRISSEPVTRYSSSAAQRHHRAVIAGINLRAALYWARGIR